MLFIKKKARRIPKYRKKVIDVLCGYVEKAFYRVPKKVIEWSMRQRSLPKMLVKAVMGEQQQEFGLDWDYQRNFSYTPGVSVVTLIICNCN